MRNEKKMWEIVSKLQILHRIQPNPRGPTKPSLNRALKRQSLVSSSQTVRSEKLQKQCDKLVQEKKVLLGRSCFETTSSKSTMLFMSPQTGPNNKNLTVDQMGIAALKEP